MQELRFPNFYIGTSSCSHMTCHEHSGIYPSIISFRLLTSPGCCCCYTRPPQHFSWCFILDMSWPSTTKTDNSTIACTRWNTAFICFVNKIISPGNSEFFDQHPGMNFRMCEIAEMSLRQLDVPAVEDQVG